jgi:hypothetical protein
MRLLRNVLVVAVALAASSAAPSGAQQKEAPAPAPDAAERRQETMRETMKELLDENVKLRKQNLDLRKDNDALKQQFQEYKDVVKQLRSNRGTLVIPPQPAPGQATGKVPQSWQPFEFNGATYYVIPLRDGDAKEQRNVAPTLKMEVGVESQPSK